ncbi:ovomucoid-like [Pantherophis guttatus]|uniref:Ovomucoid-like n=1 Tax=Pantherophis guttatus TaxID=94885 RepID=A0A6P9B095_PANGU|nr:ovomucoid-like [Pantherophis guttatus]
MKVAFCLFFTLALFFLYSDFVTEAMEEKIQCGDQVQEACTLELRPHCGSDGVTYANRCMFCNAVVRSRGALKLKHHGSCEEIRNA